MFNLFNKQNLRQDILGGVTAAIVSLPLALTFGVASGAGAEAGLYGAVLIGLFASLFGGTPTLISEPTGPMTVIIAGVIASYVSKYPDQGLTMAFTVVMLAGVFQILFGLLKMGKYITLMPYSVISGFMSGIGVILVVIQIAPALGHPVAAGGVPGAIVAMPDILSNINTAELLLTLATLAIIFLTPQTISRRVPAQLIALVAVTLVSVWFFDTQSIRRIGEISVSLPNFVLPSFRAEHIQTMVLNAAVLGMLGCIDSALTSVIADNLTRTEHKSDKELIGQGIGNIVSGLFGGLPGAGATMGTVVNIQSGARTAWSGITRVITLVIGIFGAASLLSNIPLAVLAGIAIKVGIDILDWSFLKRAHKVSFQSTMVMYSVLLLTVFVDLIVAVGIGVFVANILLIESLSASQAKRVLAISDLDDKLPLNGLQKDLLTQASGKLLYFYLSGAMIFGVSRALARERSAISEHDVILIDLSDVTLIDDTISLSIENLIHEIKEQHKHVILVVHDSDGKQQLLKMLSDNPKAGDNILVNDRTQALQQGIKLLDE